MRIKNMHEVEFNDWEHDSAPKNEETGFLDCQWNEFEDLKFSCGRSDDLSWFNYGDDSSNSELNAMNYLSKIDESGMNFLLEDKQLDGFFGRSSFGCCSDVIPMNAPEENKERRGLMESKSSQNPHEERKKRNISNFMWDTPSAHSSPSVQMYDSFSDKKKLFPRFESFLYTKPLANQVKTENDHQSQDLVHGSISCGEPEVWSNNYPIYYHSGQSAQQLGNYSWRNTSSTNHFSIKTSDKALKLAGQFEDYDGFFSEKKSQTCITSEAEFSQEKSVSMFESDQSLDLESFMKILNILDQLDSSTKLCMRDGLYRLAKSAEVRGTCSLDGIPVEKYSASEHSMETRTNAIDRSIAQLLFYRPLNSSNLPLNHGEERQDDTDVDAEMMW